ncbi:hypothetical protein NUW58_g4388 [Xylaria curta]|uniref:Uncharacterized protein n=1 Tax=Xylaria curta TaxID=42375 RepID=A0ACC1P6K7_9PEZI|nr:hypothetical protein NUW58_g4388 [Xylaria curta]
MMANGIRFFQLGKLGRMITTQSARKNPAPKVSPHENRNTDELISPQQNLGGYPGLLKLASDVRANTLKGGSMSNERFLPNDKLEELATRESVLLALGETIIEQEKHEELVTWVLESGKRLFLILVLLTRDSVEQLSWIECLKNDGINDGALPLGFPGIEPYYGYSLVAQAESSQVFHSFKHWEDNDLILFKVYQWMFLAPVFGADAKFRHQLRNEQPLPLLNLTKRSAKKGILGEILEGEIHPAHISSQCLSALGEINPGLQGIPVSIKMVQPSDNLHPFFDIDNGRFKARHATISSRLIKPIAAYKKHDEEFVIFRWVDDSNFCD